MKSILLGPPGAGKGSVAHALKEKFDLCHISTGDLLRKEIDQKTELGNLAQNYIDSGDFVSDEIMVKIIIQSLSNDQRAQSNGYLLDGFPRTVNQAKVLDTIFASTRFAYDYIFYLTCSREVILMRLTGRLICRNCAAVYHETRHPPKVATICDECGQESIYQRPDDEEETILHRLENYEELTVPILEYYRGKENLFELDGHKEPDQLVEDIMELINA